MSRSAMAEVSCEGGSGVSTELISGEVRDNAPAARPLTVWESFKEVERGSSSRRRASVLPSLDADDFINLLHGSDPVKMELNRLENKVIDKEKELGKAHSQIKGPKLSEQLRKKTVEEVNVVM